MRMPHIAIRGLPDRAIFFYIISQAARFLHKKLLNMKNVF
jgi:hypothetical protein